MEVREFLKSKEIKITKARIEILNILRKSDKSLSAENICKIVRANNMNINLSTIYRTLELFEETKITQRVSLMNGVFFYKLRTNTHKHFLECDICHKEIEIPYPMLQIEELVQNETGFTLTQHDLVLRGVCKDCKKNK